MFGTININPGSIRLWQDSTLNSQNTPLNFIFLWSKVFQYWHQVDAKCTKVGVLAPYMMLCFNQGANHKNPKINTPLKILCTNHIMKKFVAPAEGKKLLQFRYKGYATQDISACQEPTTYRHIGNQSGSQINRCVFVSTVDASTVVLSVHSFYPQLYQATVTHILQLKINKERTN